jgi:hypothetical protein
LLHTIAGTARDNLCQKSYGRPTLGRFRNLRP